MSKATPRPWRQGQDKSIVVGSDNLRVAYCRILDNRKEIDNEANAELIVRAVNCHDDLTKELYELSDQFLFNINNSQLLRIQSILKKARGEV